MDKPNELSFEEQYARLEAIVKRMEDAATPLNEMLALFEEGVGLVRSCSQILSEAEQKVVILTEGKDGTYDERSFESAE